MAERGQWSRRVPEPGSWKHRALTLGISTDDVRYVASLLVERVWGYSLRPKERADAWGAMPEEERTLWYQAAIDACEAWGILIDHDHPSCVKPVDVERQLGATAQAGYSAAMADERRERAARQAGGLVLPPAVVPDPAVDAARKHFGSLKYRQQFNKGAGGGAR